MHQHDKCSKCHKNIAPKKREVLAPNLDTDYHENRWKKEYNEFKYLNRNDADDDKKKKLKKSKSLYGLDKKNRSRSKTRDILDSSESVVAHKSKRKSRRRSHSSSSSSSEDKKSKRRHKKHHRRSSSSSEEKKSKRHHKKHHRSSSSSSSSSESSSSDYCEIIVDCCNDDRCSPRHKVQSGVINVTNAPIGVISSGVVNFPQSYVFPPSVNLTLHPSSSINLIDLDGLSVAVTNVTTMQFTWLLANASPDPYTGSIDWIAHSTC